MLQQPKPGDYVLATGEAHTVRELVERAFAVVGRKIAWRGKGQDEIGVDEKTGDTLIEIDPNYFRPTEVDFLLGDPSKAHRELGWKHRVSFNELIEEMVKSDLEQLARRGT